MDENRALGYLLSDLFYFRSNVPTTLNDYRESTTVANHTIILASDGAEAIDTSDSKSKKWRAKKQGMW